MIPSSPKLGNVPAPELAGHCEKVSGPVWQLPGAELSCRKAAGAVGIRGFLGMFSFPFPGSRFPAPLVVSGPRGPGPGRAGKAELITGNDPKNRAALPWRGSQRGEAVPGLSMGLGRQGGRAGGTGIVPHGLG